MALEGCERSASRPGRYLHPGKIRYPLYRRLSGPQVRSGQVRKISPPTGIRSPDCLVRSQSLYRLRSPAHNTIQYYTNLNNTHLKHLNCKLYYQQLHLKYWCNLARYCLQAVWGWYDSVETCKSVIICEIIVHLFVIIQNTVLLLTTLRLSEIRSCDTTDELVRFIQ
jgi:hypothetical protein